MAIACAYCKGEHDSAAQIKQCWQDGGQLDVPVGDDGAMPDPSGDVPQHGDAAAEIRSRSEQPDDDQRRRTSRRIETSPARRSQPGTRRAVVATVARGVAPAQAGPETLGRHLVVGPTASAETGAAVPAPWTDAPRVLITDDTLAEPNDALVALRTAHHQRHRLVIELAADFDRAPTLMTDAPPFEVGATFTFELEELHHLVWSNSVDRRDPSAPAWGVLDLAIAAGASVGGAGDVVTPSGAEVWLDGGPVRYTAPIEGLAVLHAVAVEHGSFLPPSGNTCGADLAHDQLEAVTHDGGAARIIAPAGSGKTRVLTERARHLLATWRLPASAVCLVAFNKRAQEEMAERTTDLDGLQIRTLNALALAIVNGSMPFAAQPKRWNTIDEIDVRRIIGDIVSFPRRRNSDPVAPWIEALSLIRLGLVHPEDAEARYDGDVDGLAAAWPAYRAALERRGAVDFDDQIHRALLVLLTQPEARRAAQRACRVMLVDEFQDLTPAHLLMIRLLASPGGAVFGVGDDDQTIYGYNGADPAWLIDFATLFPGAGAHPLEVNYRCPSGVVDIVDRLLRHNSRRVSKVVHASSTDAGGWSIDSSVDPVGATCQAVERALGEGAATSDIAVLTRVNALLAPVQVALSARQVAISGGVGLEFVDRTAVRTALSWLRLARSASTRFRPEDVREALRRPSRSFHPRINDWVCEQGSIVDLHRLAGRLNNDRDTERVIEFASDVEQLQQLVKTGAPTSDVVLSLIDDVGLAGAVAPLDAERRGMNRAAQSDDLTAVQHLAALHDDLNTFESWLRSHLAVKRSPDGVVLSTVHRVKGQEWPHVIVHLADVDQYPHRLADDVEEERRLFHVAITRAGREATIVTGPTPSSFVEELTTEPPEHPVEPAERERPAGGRSRSATGSKGTTGRSGRSSGGSDPAAELDAAGQRRFAALKELRNELRDGKPAYVVFDNKTLVSIARIAPTTRIDLSKISGIGPAKLDKYGDAVIELIESLLIS